MKLKIKKIFGTLLASLACFTVGIFSPVHASCENAPSSGSKFKMTGPDTFKLRTTFQTFIDTKNARKLNLALTRADRQAQFDLSEFFKGVFNGDLDVDADGQDNGDNEENDNEKIAYVIHHTSQTSDN